MHKSFIYVATNEELTGNSSRSIVSVPPNITDKAILLSLFSHLLQFPDYFGNNWDAFEECLRDLSWLPEGPVVLAHSDLPLANEPLNAQTYISVLEEAVRAQSKSNAHPLTVTFPIECMAQIERLRFSQPAAETKH